MVCGDCSVIAAELERTEPRFHAAIVLVDLIPVGLSFDFNPSEKLKACVSYKFRIDMKFAVTLDANAILGAIVGEGCTQMVVARNLSIPFRSHSGSSDDHRGRRRAEKRTHSSVP